MKVGSLVECINDTPHLGKWMNNLPLIKGNIYTVSGFNHYGNGIFLEEIITDWAYFITYFREIQPPMEINIEELMLEKVPA